MKKIIEKGRLLSAKARCFAQNFGQDESGMGTVEVVLIIVVLIGLYCSKNIFDDSIDLVLKYHYKANQHHYNEYHFNSSHS